MGEKEMRKYLSIGLLLIAIIVISGCTTTYPPPTDQPYISSVQPDQNYLYSGSSMNIQVGVTNPTKLNYVGQVLLQPEQDRQRCFDIEYFTVGTKTDVYGILRNITVLANGDNTVLLKVTSPDTSVDNCYQPASHTFRVFILQNSKTLDLETLILSLYRKGV